MSSAAFLSWSLSPGWLLLLLPAAIFYFRGWLRLRRILPLRYSAWRLVFFWGGLLVLYASVASPLDAFASLLLQAHMVQHLLLTMLAPPLLLLGNPLVPLLRGLPRNWARNGVAPLLNWRPLKRLGRFLIAPPFALGLFMLSNIVWHIPRFYDAALASNSLHEFEHASFFLTALLFWWPIVEPWPFRASWPRWTMIPYLILADLQNTLLGGFLSFYNGILYETYRLAPRISGVSAAADQSAAGALMWVLGSMAYFIPAGVIAFKFLSSRKGVRPSEYLNPEKKAPVSERKKISTRPHRTELVFDLLALPIFGPLLGSLVFRRGLQMLLLLLAALVVVDGLFGTQVSPLNLAGVLPWTYWRAFSVIALLIVGNVFCFSCPFILFRDVLRKFISPHFIWPRRLRLKWLVLFFLLFLFMGV
ncbi:MAG: cytochrome c oxidase assembly protein [Chthoniobacterales bacterium]